MSYSRLNYSSFYKFENSDKFNQWWDENRVGWKTSYNKKLVKTKVNKKYFKCSRKKDPCTHKIQVLYHLNGSVEVFTTLKNNADLVSSHEHSLKLPTNQSNSQQNNTFSGQFNQQNNTASSSQQNSIFNKPRLFRKNSLFNYKRPSITLRKLEKLANPTLLDSEISGLCRLYGFFESYTSQIDSLNQIALKELKDYVIKKAIEPANDDKPFIVGGNLFENGIVIWATKKKRQIQNSSKVLVIRVIENIECLGLKFIFVGTFNSNNTFIPTYFAMFLPGFDRDHMFFEFNSIITNDSIYKTSIVLTGTNEFLIENVDKLFPTAKHHIFTYDFVKDISFKLKQLNCIGDGDKEMIKKDIEMLCSVFSQEQFEHLSKLLIEKWTTTFGENFEFATYFQKTFIEPKFKWILGPDAQFFSYFDSFWHTKLLRDLFRHIKSMRFFAFANFVESEIFANWDENQRKENFERQTFNENDIISQFFAKSSNFATNTCLLKYLPFKECDVFLFTSREFIDLNSEKMVEMIRLSMGCEFGNFVDYAESRFKVCVVHKFNERFMCSCSKGILGLKCEHLHYLDEFVGLKNTEKRDGSSNNFLTINFGNIVEECEKPTDLNFIEMSNLMIGELTKISKGSVLNEIQNNNLYGNSAIFSNQNEMDYEMSRNLDEEMPESLSKNPSNNTSDSSMEKFVKKPNIHLSIKNVVRHIYNTFKSRRVISTNSNSSQIENNSSQIEENLSRPDDLFSDDFADHLNQKLNSLKVDGTLPKQNIKTMTDQSSSNPLKCHNCNVLIVPENFCVSNWGLCRDCYFLEHEKLNKIECKHCHKTRRKFENGYCYDCFHDLLDHEKIHGTPPSFINVEIDPRPSTSWK